MTEEKWKDVKSMIKDKFEIIEEKLEPIELKTGLDESQKIGEKEVIIFLSPMGKVKLEYLVKPVVLDKKEHYNKRMGTSSKTQYFLSDTEFVRRMDAFIYKNDSWEKIQMDNFSL